MSIDCVSLVNVTDNLPSTDHSAIEFSLSVAIPIQSRCRRTLYNYKKSDFNAFRVKSYLIFPGIL